ncbi:MAG: OmpA family protein [Cyclobacteriaceae bacterium]|jgi:outer membrane protein OmpA-like peptidoglycan-associated protein|nr:OmpA family protein [Cytophagales bacterium]MCZ8328324.1 OmpA family protein [Cyclobacteriaceae bacterium]
MKKFYLLALLAWLCGKLSAQTTNELPAGYYVVVAAYDNQREEYAALYTETLKAKNYQASYGFNKTKNLFFVYIDQKGNLKDALQSMYRVRKESSFEGAWVRVVPGIIGQSAEPPKPVITPEVLAKTGDVPVKEEKRESKKEEKKETANIVDVPLKEEQPVVTETKVEEQATTEPEEKIIQHTPMTLGNSEIFLSLFNASNNRIVDGEVTIVDAERGRVLKTVKGNEYTTLPDPKSTSGKLLMICDVFGYRKLQHEGNFKNPQADTVNYYFQRMGLSFVVTFDLVRYRKGDIQTLSHVYFFNDAAIMLPESLYEVNVLLQMMTENPNMKVRLRGHTNGNYHGKIVKMGPDKSFFALTKQSVSVVGSAKQLSYERAEIIKEYLLTKGIAADRIEVKGYGGKKPLFDKHGANAKKNVRVEVEVLAD